ncbi:hypothetical protein CVS37_02500 [Burkholderia lata]|nr:hypothetical protein CVS37_02500 [Burkholderia lata]
MINIYMFFIQMKIRASSHNIVTPILELQLTFILIADQRTSTAAIKLQQPINNFRKIDPHRRLLRSMSRARFTMIAENPCNLFEF